MPEPTTMTSKGQVTVPQVIRQRLGLRSGDKIAFTLLADGTVILRPKTLKPQDVAGVLRQSGQQRISIDDMRVKDIESDVPDAVLEMAGKAIARRP